MARFRLGLAGVLTFAFVSVWFVHGQPCCAGAWNSAFPAHEMLSEEGRMAGEALAFASSSTSSTDDPSDDFWCGRRAASLRAPHRSWWRIGPPTPDAALRRPRARSTGPPVTEA